MGQKSSGWDESAEAWQKFVDAGDDNRSFVLDPCMIRLMGEIKGLNALDIGCGEGRFCRMLAERGATVTGLDPTNALLETAKGRDCNSKYVQGFAENLPFSDSSFDLVVSYVALCDIADYRKAISEMARVTKPRGRILVANLSSLASSAPFGWRRDEQGRRDVFPVDNYTFESGVRVGWKGIEIVNYHRSMADYMSAFLGQGLVLKAFEEPIPCAEEMAARNAIADFARVPYFVVMDWHKP